MAELTLTYPDEVEGRILDAVATAYGYQELVPDEHNDGAEISNPQSKKDFAKAILGRFLQQTVASAEGRNAADRAHQSAVAQVQQDIVVS